MLNLRRFLILALMAGLGLPGLARAAHTSARLILAQEVARPGDTVWAGIRLKMDEGWHTYWRNSGDSGLPTTIAWKLPEGVTAGEIEWPVPEKYFSSQLYTYVYHGEAVLLVPLKLSDSIKAGPLKVTANLKWLECSEKVCVPGQAEVSAPLTVGSDAKPSVDAASIEAARKKLPPEKAPEFVQAWWANPPTAQDTRALIIEWPRHSADAAGDFFPYAAETITVQPATAILGPVAGRIRVKKVVEKLRGDWPKSVAGLVIEEVGGAIRSAFATTIAVAEAAPPGSIESPAGEVSAPPTATTATAATTAASGIRALLLNLGLAFLGGLILNLMPCVLPVIALKILGFVNQSHGSPGEVRRLGVIYGLGVLVSMLVLAGIIVAVKSADQTASWGMQFQNRFFVVALTTLVLLVALNLFGVFEVTLGAGAMGKAGELAGREGAAGAFFNGVLAVVLATPCTAPFLGAALGFAFVQPAPVTVLSFSAVGAGLAAPYVLLSFFPRFLKFIPKPGPWMERFKVGMGFPMIATALWLLTVNHAHFGSDGVLWVGLFLVFVAAAMWVWGQFVQRGRTRKGLAAVIAMALLGFGYGFGLENQLEWRTPGGKIKWQPWSAAAVEKARDEGHPVIVDFTATWCVTCKANKATSIEITSVRRRLKETGAVPLIGDFSAADETIAKELERFGRAGVPLVLVYPKDKAKPPIVLPEVLTPSIVLDALDKAAE